MYFALGRNATFDERRINESSKNQSRLEGIFPYSHESSHFLFILRDSLLICGIVLNVLVLYVMLRSRKIRKNLSSFLIFHLSLSHVLLYCLLPIFRSAPFFSCACKELAHHLFGAAIFATLATIAGDRYRNIAQPFKSLAPRRLKTFFLLILGIWLFALATTMPVFFTMQARTENFCQKKENETAEKCYKLSYCYWPSKGKLPRTMYFFFAFLLPFFSILLAYTKAALSLWKRTKKATFHSAVAMHKAKTVRLMVIAVCIFALGWGPKFFVDFLRAYSVPINLPSRHFFTLRKACEIAEVLSLCLSPVIYAFLNPDFRKLFYKFCCCFCRHRPTCLRHRRCCFNSVHPIH